MQNAYGVHDLGADSKKHLIRQNSRTSCRSVRSSLSVGAPVLSKTNRFQGKSLLTDQPVVTLMPSLKKQNEKPPVEEFDEEKEQAQLEEARKRKERAKKMREQ